MKTFTTTLSLLVLSSLAHPGVSHALVREMALCHTSDGNYQVSVQNNEGIGFHRAAHVVASVASQNGTVVGSYDAAAYQQVSALDTGRPHFSDTKSRGQSFVLAGPSGDQKNYVLRARINGGSIDDENVNCQIFETK